MGRTTYLSDEARHLVEQYEQRIGRLEQLVSDHAQRFETLQTPWWKRVWFWVNGWPWYDLNAAAPRPRPWHRWIRP